MEEYPFIIHHRGKQHLIRGNLHLLSAHSSIFSKYYSADSRYLTLSFSDDFELDGLRWVWDFLHGIPYHKPTGPFKQRVSILQLLRALEIDTTFINISLQYDMFSGLPRPDPSAYDFHDVGYLNRGISPTHIDNDYLSLFPVDKRVGIVPPTLREEDLQHLPIIDQPVDGGNQYLVDYNSPVRIYRLHHSREDYFFRDLDIGGSRNNMRVMGLEMPAEWPDDGLLIEICINETSYFWYDRCYYEGGENGRLAPVHVAIFRATSKVDNIRLLPKHAERRKEILSKLFDGTIGTSFEVGTFRINGFCQPIMARSLLITEASKHSDDRKYYQGIEIKSKQALFAAWSILNHLFTVEMLPATIDEITEMWRIVNYFNVPVIIPDITELHGILLGKYWGYGIVDEISKALNAARRDEEVIT